MAKLLADAALDLALNLIKNNCNLMVACSQQPTTYTQATSTYALASVSMTSGNYTLADGDVDGRKLTTAAKNTVAVTASGTITHVALVDTTNSVLYIVTTTTSQAVTAGNTIDFPAWAIALADVFLAEGVGPLKQSAVNGRYFTDGTGKAIYLAGAHTWRNLQDIGVGDPPPVFDYVAWLDYLQARGNNFFRLWAWEQSRKEVETTANIWVDINIYARTGPGNAGDGKLKFDLTQFNQTYFDRLRQRVILAGQRGMYVAVMLWNGWSVAYPHGGVAAANPFLYHPYYPGNNINSLNGDPNGDHDGSILQTLTISAVTTYQEAYVQKVIDTVNDLDNVLYEISNESVGSTNNTNWHNHFIDYIHTYEASKPKRHPVIFSSPWPDGSNTTMLASNAEAFSPNDDGVGYATALDDPPIPTGAKVSIWDVDHIGGIIYDTDFPWKAFCRGQNPLLMDEYDGLYSVPGDEGGTDVKSDATVENIRYNLGYTVAYAKRMDLINMTPSTTLCNTNYCLAKTNAEYLCYQPGSGSFTLNLSAASGTFNIEWFRPSTYATQSGGTTTGGATRTLTPPSGWSPAVAYVYK